MVTDLLAMRLAVRRALAQAEMTSIEVDHRAMNSLQFVASLLEQQSYAALLPDTAHRLRTAVDRVQAVSRVHRAFTTVGSVERVPILVHLREFRQEPSRSLGTEIQPQSIEQIEVPLFRCGQPALRRPHPSDGTSACR